MRNVKLTVRCLVEQKNDHWQAFSLEFGLAAQAETASEAKQKLESMIRAFVFDALAGEDQEYADELLNRRATWAVYAKYYIALVASYFGKNGVYTKAMPLVPAVA